MNGPAKEEESQMLVEELGQSQQQYVGWRPGPNFRTFAWTAILIPPICFYILLWKSLCGIPYLDDYGGSLSFLLKWKRERGLQHLLQIITWQHNEYRLMLLNLIVGLQYWALGHVDLKTLAMLGNVFILLMLGVLYLIWQKDNSPSKFTLLVFVSISWMLFQLQYASAMNTSNMSLQHLPAIVFAMLACYLAAQPNAAAFIGSLCCMVLAIASSGNGLFLIPIGCILFLQQKKYRRLALWLATSAVMCFLYFHGYNFHASQTHADHDLLSSSKHLSPTYAAAFLGSIATVTNPVPAVLLGILLLTTFFIATKDRVFESNPALYYSALFFFVTAVAVSGLRSDGGLTTALGSRYRINSTIIVILMYMFVIEKYQEFLLRLRRPMAMAIICFVGLVLVGFNLTSNRAGYRFLLTRRQKLDTAMLRWGRHEPRQEVGAATDDDYTMTSEKKGYYEPREQILKDSIAAGIYHLPTLPEEH
jgi:hypothetical protein